MIKGLGKLVGIGDAPTVEAESEDGAEAGPRPLHVSTCVVPVPRYARILAYNRSGC